MSIVREDESPLFKTADKNYMAIKIDEMEEGKVLDDNEPNFSVVVARYVSLNQYDDMIEYINVAASTIYTFSFAVESYFPPGE
jgi:hypothetical protein